MEVTLKIATKSDPKPSIKVSAAITARTPEGVDRMIDTLRTARAWLVRELQKKDSGDAE